MSITFAHPPASSPTSHAQLITSYHIDTPSTPATDYVKRFRRLCRLVPDVNPEQLEEVRQGERRGEGQRHGLGIGIGVGRGAETGIVTSRHINHYPPPIVYHQHPPPAYHPPTRYFGSTMVTLVSDDEYEHCPFASL